MGESVTGGVATRMERGVTGDLRGIWDARPTEGRPGVGGTTRATRVRLLGELEVATDGEPVAVSLAGQRVLVLLAVLHRDRPAARTALAERLWPDLPGDRAVSSLRSTLWRLPRPRGRLLVASTPRTVGLADHLAVDLWEADDAIAGGTLVADGLLDHDLLPRWEEDWLEVEREGFRQRRLHALESASSSLRRDGRYADALTTALTAVRAEPLRETAHLRVIEVHLTEGNQSEAVRQYEHYRALLHAELGLGPSETLHEVMAPLLRRRTRRPRVGAER